MIYIYAVILAGYLLLFLVSAKEAGNPFQKMAAYILRRQRQSRSGKGKRDRNWKRALFEKQLSAKLKTLQPQVAEERQLQEHYRSLYSTILMVVFVGDLLCLAVWAGARSSPQLIDGSYLSRNDYGEGEVSVGLAAEIPGIQEELFDYLLEERKFTTQELEKQYDEAQALFPAAILGENERLEDVRKNLNLVSELPEYPFRISWESSAYSLVDTDGTVHNEELEAGEIVTLTAQFCYEDWRRECQFPVQVNPAVCTPQEAIRSRLENLLKEHEENTRNEETMTLPDRIGSEPILWREIIDDSSGYFFCWCWSGQGLSTGERAEK